MAHRTCKLLVAFVLLVLVLPAQAQRRGDAITISIPAAAIQGATTGHAYWINVDDAGVGSLVDAGTSIAAAGVTNQPPFWLDVARFPGELSWSVFYGAQTGNVGGKIGMAELWPSQPVEVPGTIPPFVRDVASHWLVTAGLGFVLQQRLPSDRDVVYDVTSALATALDTGGIPTDDFDSLRISAVCSAGTTTLGTYEALDDASYLGLNNNAAPAANVQAAWGRGIAASGGSAAVIIYNAFDVPPRSRFNATSAGAGNSVRLHIIGERKRPLRRPSRIAPYIQWVNPGTGGATPVVPTAASPIYLVLRGR